MRNYYYEIQNDSQIRFRKKMLYLIIYFAVFETLYFFNPLMKCFDSSRSQSKTHVEECEVVNQ